MQKAFKSLVSVLIVLVAISLYVERNEVRSAIRYNGVWACDGRGYSLLYFDGKQTIELGEEDTGDKIPPPEKKPDVWCERSRPILLIWLFPDEKALKAVRVQNNTSKRE